VTELHRHQALIRTALGEVEEHPELIRPSEDPMVQAGGALAAYLERVRNAGLAGAGFDARTVASLLLSALFVDAIVRDVMPGIFGPDLEHDARAYVATVLRGIGVELRETRMDG
jgi:hypothetical protein